MSEYYDDPSVFDDPNVLVGIKEAVSSQLKNSTPSETPQFLDHGLQRLPVENLRTQEGMNNLLELALASPHPTKLDFRPLYYGLTEHAGKTELLQVSKELLPEEWLEKCKTDSQRQAWYKHTIHYVKLHFSILSSAMNAYYCGEASPLPLFPHRTRDIYGGLTDSYLALYDLLQYGFKYIEAYAEAAEQGLKEEIFRLNAGDPQANGQLKELRKLRRKLIQIKLDLKSPAGTLRAIVVKDAEVVFGLQFKFYYRFDPKEAHKLHNIDMSLRYKPQDVTEQERADYRKTLEKNRQEFEPFTDLRDFCLEACAYMAKAQQDKNLERKLKEYKGTKENIDLWLQPLLHQRHTGVIQIVKGERL